MSVMYTHVLLNLLSELMKNIRCEALSSILSFFSNEIDEFNSICARMQYSIYYMTLNWHWQYQSAIFRHM